MGISISKETECGPALAEASAKRAGGPETSERRCATVEKIMGRVAKLVEIGRRGSEGMGG